MAGMRLYHADRRETTGIFHAESMSNICSFMKPIVVLPLKLGVENIRNMIYLMGVLINWKKAIGLTVGWDYCGQTTGISYFFTPLSKEDGLVWMRFVNMSEQNCFGT